MKCFGSSLIAAGLIASVHAAGAADGAKVFTNSCEACHAAGGAGTPGLAPPLVSPVIANAAVRQKDYPALVVLNGLAGLLPLADGSTMAGVMPSQQSLTDEEAAAVVSYIYRLNHAKTAIKAQDIGRLRTQPASADDLRRAHKDLLK